MIATIEDKRSFWQRIYDNWKGNPSPVQQFALNLAYERNAKEWIDFNNELNLKVYLLDMKRIQSRQLLTRKRFNK